MSGWQNDVHMLFMTYSVFVTYDPHRPSDAALTPEYCRDPGDITLIKEDIITNKSTRNRLSIC